MARTFVDDTYSYFDEDITLTSGKKPKPFLFGSKVGQFLKKAGFTSSPSKLLEVYRARLIQLRDLRTKLTLIRGADAVTSTNQQINKIQAILFELEKQFVSLFADKQGAKNVINSVTSNPDLLISDNKVAQLFLNQKPITTVVTPVFVVTGGGYGGGMGYEEPSATTPKEPAIDNGSEVVDKPVEPKKDNTILYLGIGIIAVILLTRK